MQAQRIYFLYGNEPYLADSRIKQLKKSINLDELGYMESSNFEEAEYTFLKQPAFFSCNKMLLYRPENLKENPFLIKYLEQPAMDSILIIYPVSCDRRTKFFKTLINSSTPVVCDKVADADLLKFVRSKLSLSPELEGFFLECVGYATDDAVNLYTVSMYIKKLQNVSMEITAEVIADVCGQSHYQQVFQMRSYIEHGDFASFHKELMKTPAKEVIKVLSFLLRDVRVALKGCAYRKQEIGVTYIPLAKFPKDALITVEETLSELVSGIKHGDVRDTDALLRADVLFLNTLMKGR